MIGGAINDYGVEGYTLFFIQHPKTQHPKLFWGKLMFAEEVGQV